jgi:hypothetical protein
MHFLKSSDAIRSRIKHAIEILVWPNPDPHPEIPFETLRDSANISCYPHRPKTCIATQALKMQTRMRGTACEFLVGPTRRTFQIRRQYPIQTPEVVRATRLHSCLSNSSSVSSRNCSGFSRTRASISSPNAVNAGRGRGSRMIDSQRASPSNSGTRLGSDSASCARSSAERLLIAFAISSTVLTNKFYDKGPGFTRPRLVR